MFSYPQIVAAAHVLDVSYGGCTIGFNGILSYDGCKRLEEAVAGPERNKRFYSQKEMMAALADEETTKKVWKHYGCFNE